MMENGLSKWKLLALLAGLWVVADQVTKYLAVEHLTAAFIAARAHTFRQGALGNQFDFEFTRKS